MSTAVLATKPIFGYRKGMSEQVITQQPLIVIGNEFLSR